MEEITIIEHLENLKSKNQMPKEKAPKDKVPKDKINYFQAPQNSLGLVFNFVYNNDLTTYHIF
jgi:hypothetical protein